METRRARAEDLSEIGTLLQAIDHPALPAGIATSNVLVGVEEGSIIGAVALDLVARRGLIVSVAVSAKHQDGNTAASLVGSLIARAHELGLRQLYALNEEASEVLSGLGFSRVSASAVPDEVKSMRSYPSQADEADGVMCLELETRL